MQRLGRETGRSVLISIIVLLAGVVIVTISQSDLHPLLIILWSAVVLFLGVALASVLGIIKRKTATASIIIAALIAIPTAMTQLHVVPLCGDGVCAESECGSCAQDCSPTQCVNGKCDTPMEMCYNSPDCKCRQGQVCSPGRKLGNTLPDSKGCIVGFCGDGFCDKPESPSTCCNDCGCQSYFSCLNNTCAFQLPRLTMRSIQATTDISATSLAGNPQLYDANGNSQPLLALLLDTTGVLLDANMTFDIPGHLTTVVPLGRVSSYSDTPIFWYPQSDSRLLTITEDTMTNITVTLRYRDLEENVHSAVWYYPLLLRSRSTIDKYGSQVLFVTNDIPTGSSSASDIWNELHHGIAITGQHPRHLQFPLETLGKKQGSPDDIAVLLVSAYMGKGLRPSLVQTADGLHVRVRGKDNYETLDPQLFNQSYEDAIVYVPAPAILDPYTERAARNFTVLSVNGSMLYPPIDTKGTLIALN